ncbi:cobalamin binding intrinsic factor-like [Emydura macquarii macquarii]|uniref:cobalamin binding intrinsic factor-like n=1 Tax=Emydura macquarii macquarii TaxID=1129001 RepID=UPI00352A3E85
MSQKIHEVFHSLMSHFMEKDDHRKQGSICRLPTLSGTPQSCPQWETLPRRKGRMFPWALAVLCALCAVTSASEKCIVPANQQYLVTELQRRMESSVILQSSPNPSILIALNLAGTQDGEMEKLLVEQIKEKIVKEGTEKMTSGEVALNVLALLSSCEDPQSIAPHINLVKDLASKTKDELSYLRDHGTPKTTFYQLSLDVLALCLEKEDIEEAAVSLAKEALAKDFSVDTGAMATLALTCVHNGLVKAEQSRILDAIQEALNKLHQQILKAVETNTANIYSIGLALQALSVTLASYPSGDWSCSQTLTKVLNEISQGAFNNPMAAAQILPSLVGKTYLNVIGPSCSPNKVMVEYTVGNNLRGQPFNYTTCVSVPRGSVLLAVLQAAAQANPHFSYKTEQTSWGLMVVSINDLAANSNDKTYWQFFNGTEPLDQGVESYIPANNEHIKALFSKY